MNDDNIPFEQLELIGLNRRRYESLPQEVKDKFAAGELTPVISNTISYKENG